MTHRDCGGSKVAPGERVGWVSLNNEVPMRRFTTIVVLPLALLFAVDGIASSRDARMSLREARTELAALESIAARSHPSMRGDMLVRIDRVDRLLEDATRELPAEGSGPQAFDAAYTRVARETFDQDKLAVIRGIAGSGQRFTSEQVRQLVSLVDFEFSRYDALVALHRSVIDPQRYPMVFDVLDFSMNRRKLEQELGYAR